MKINAPQWMTIASPKPLFIPASIRALCHIDFIYRHEIMTEQQPNPLSQARQGNGNAIAALINQSLQPQGIVARVVLKPDGTLKVLLESATQPDEQVLVPFVQQGIAVLELAQVTTLQIIGRIQGAPAPAWTRTISMGVASQIAPSSDVNSEPANDLEEVEARCFADTARVAAHLNQTIATPGIVFAASLTGDILKITAQTDQLLQADTFAKTIREQLLPMNLKEVATVHLYKQKTRGNSGYKVKEFSIAPELNDHQSLNELTEVSSQDPVKLSSKSSSQPGVKNKPNHRLPIFILAAIVTVLFIIGVRVLSTPPTVKQLCTDADGSQAQCQLVVDLTGAQTLADLKEEAIAFTEKTTEVSLDACGKIAMNGKNKLKNVLQNRNVRAGESLEIFPGILLTDVQISTTKAPNAIAARVACVFQKTNTDPRPIFIASDLIPNDFPKQPYKASAEKSSGESVSRSLKVFDILIQFGAYTVFTAIGLALVSFFQLGMQFYSLNALFQAACVLGFVETLMHSIPGMGFVGGIPFTSVALLITSHWVKDFRIDWAAGYRLVGGGVFVVLTVRFVLSWILLGTILSIV
jgi:hypothetical protein